LALRENGDGMTVLGFALYGIPPNEQTSAFRALPMARAKPRWIVKRSATTGTLGLTKEIE
jgi:hypothetical protein